MTEISPSKRKGRTYEATYTGWLDFFKSLAVSKDRVRVTHAPACWNVFIRYMGHIVSQPAHWFPEDTFTIWGSMPSDYEGARRFTEIASGARPELAHALYLWDTEWRHTPEARARVYARDHGQSSKEFVVACNGSFFRQEVFQYLALLHAWRPSKAVCLRPLVICPCAADKPYPAPLHTKIKQAVRSISPCSLMVATGVLGLVPEELWGVAPWYDAGIPNNDRVYKETLRFFSAYRHVPGVLVYSDFYAYWVTRGLRDAGQRFVSVFGMDEIANYLDLTSSANLKLLKEHYARLFAKRRS